MLDANDHRHIGREQKLFHFRDEAPGMVFWHPAGLTLYRRLEEAARRQLSRSGYAEVRTPEVLSQAVWEASGHWHHFAEGMFKLERDEGRALALRPVNCPGHAQIFRHGVRSYRELPLRLAEFGVVHRREPSGALAGLFRLRQFTQDDGHVFCSDDQLAREVLDFCRSIGAFYASFGFSDVQVGLSTRPPERIGDDESWERAERALERAAREAGMNPLEQPGEGAFYGPKLEFKLRDRLGRVWQCGTIQLDFFMPERFDLVFVDEGGQRRRPVMLHRALYGSLERFLGVLLEHYAGELPAWLAPEQAHVLAVSPLESDYAEELHAALMAAGVSSVVSDAEQRVATRVASARAARVPFLLVVGPREVRAREVSLRHGDHVERLGVEATVARVAQAVRPPA